MPWRESGPMEERLQFVRDAQRDRFTMSELCAYPTRQLRCSRTNQERRSVHAVSRDPPPNERCNCPDLRMLRSAPRGRAS